MEQPPKMPTEQIDLFEAEVKLEDRTTEDLELLFEEAVGFSARTRFLGRPDAERRRVLIEGINDPKKGKDAVAEWDADYDKIGDAWSGK